MNFKKIEDIYPLSPMQQGLLFHSLYEAESGIYVNQLGCYIDRGLNRDAFRRAWEEVVRRHGVLRSGMVWEGLKSAVQVVHREVELPWREEDWRGIEVEEQKERWQRFLGEDQRSGFDLRQAPLMRLALMRTGEQSYFFAWSNHHIVLDGWCRQVVIGEVFKLYEGYRRGEEVRLEPAGAYRDYIGWLQNQDEGRAEAFWREELAGFREPTRLWIERTEGSRGRRSEYEQKRLRLEESLAEKLEETARQQQVTLNTVLQGAWGVLLSLYSGQREVVFGATVSGRSAEVEGIESLVGLFINTLPVRIRLDGMQEVSTYLKQLQRRQVEARQYEYSPLVKVQEWSEVGRGRRLFEYLLVFENYPMDAEMLKRIGMTINLDELQNLLIQNSYAMTLRASWGEEYLLELIHERECISGEEGEKILQGLRRILEQMVEGPGRRVGELSVLSAEEREQVLVGWNVTGEEYEGEWRIERLIEEQVRRRPEAVAVVSEGKKLSYGELNRRGNQLGHYLRRAGVGPEARVGVSLERGVEMIWAVLGVLKAGGAYVAVDEGYPEARQKYMVEDAGVRVVMSRGAGAERLKKLMEGGGVRVIDVNGEWEEISRESEGEVDVEREAENLAYVMYTSGSTGKAKGVGIEQRQLVNYVRGIERKLQLGAGAKYATVTTLSADLGNTVIYPALVSGGELHVVREERVLDGEWLGEYLEEAGIDCLKIVPSHLVGLQGVGGGEKVMPGRVLVVGGEASQWKWVESWRKSKAGCRIVNHYGPTETTVGALTYEVGEESGAGSVPIGRPLGNVRVYVLDEEQEPVPVGVGGELYIGGAGVGRGYVGKGGQTAEKFVPDPFTGAGERLYRTGDMVRYRADGELEFIGRKDDQVKVRGYRIELGEIEAELRGYAGVEQGVVVARGEGVGDKQLVCYVVRRSGERVEESWEKWKEGLKGHFRERLPDYMVPAVYVELEAMPLTSNGKVDRRGLPEPERLGEEKYIGPRNEVEEVLCQVWAEVLGVERVGVEDNFFELGGDSILSIQAVARARERGVEITPKQMFECQTVRLLSEVAGKEQRVEAEQGRVEGRVPLTAIQAAFFGWGLKKSEHYNQSVLLKLKEGVEGKYLEEAVRELVIHHDSLRMSYEEVSEGKWEQRCRGEVEWEGVYARRQVSGIEELSRDAEQVQGSLDLRQGRLLRAVEYEVGGGEGSRLLLVIHHLVVDGVSWRILLEDLERGYEQLKGGEAVKLGKKTSSYKEWSERMEEYGRSAEVRAELGYWLEQGKSGAAGLPRDYAGEENNRVESEGRVVEWLSEVETDELLQRVPEVYHTQVNDVLLTALWMAVSEWSGCGEVLVDLEGHGREEVLPGLDVSRTVGWFTTIYPVVLGEKKAEREIGRALKRTKEQLRRVPQKGLAYGLLRYVSGEEQPSRELARVEAQIRFNYLGQLDQMMAGSEHFGLSEEGHGPGRGKENRRRYVLDVNGMVMQGRMRVSWGYSEKLHRRQTVEQLAGRYVQCLREILEHCRSKEAGGYTPSDFPLARLNQEELDRIGSLLK